jgi:excisionase family DNA binding protein
VSPRRVIAADADPEAARYLLGLVTRALLPEMRGGGVSLTPLGRTVLTELHQASVATPGFADETSPAGSPTVELAVVDAARVIGSSVQWVRRLASSGEVAARRVGRSWLIDADDLDRYRHRRPA